MSVLVWLGSQAPERSIRWLDGAIATAASFADSLTSSSASSSASSPSSSTPGEPTVHALAAGSAAWLELATDRATRAGLGSIGVPTDLELDYLGWGQLVAAVARRIDATWVLVDEASRPARSAEVAAIAELLDWAQLTHVVSLTPDAGDGRDLLHVHARRAAGRDLQSVRVTGPAVLGLRIAGAPIEEYPTPMPSKAMRRLELASLALDPNVLAHRALPPRARREPHRTVDEVAQHLALHVTPRRGGRG